MKYRILEIHPRDAFYEERNELVGKILDLTNVKEWTEADTPAGYSEADGDGYIFYAVKLAPVDEQTEALTNLALALSVALSEVTDADMRTKLDAMNEILIGALKTARNDNALLAIAEEMKG